MTLRGESHKLGDIVVVDGHEEPLFVRRLALVVSVEEEANHLQVMLCHDDLRLASIVDAIIMGAESGLSYDLVVQTDLFSAVWKSQVKKRIGGVAPILVRKIMAHGMDPDLLVDGIQTGYAIQGVIDPRWKFKENEGGQLRSLCADCVSTLLSKESVTVDLDIFKLCDEDEIINFLDLVKEKIVVLTERDLDEMKILGVFSRSFWKNRFPSYGLGDAIYIALIKQFGIRERAFECSEETITQGRINGASPLFNAGIPIITSKNLWVDFEATLESAPNSLQLLAV